MAKVVTMEVGRWIVLGKGGRDGGGGNGGRESNGGENINKIVTPPSTTKEIEKNDEGRENYGGEPPLPLPQTK